MKFKFKNVLVYGLSVSGEWVARLLKKLKANVFLFDDDVEKLKEKRIKGCSLVENINENLIEQFDFIVVSPSIEKDNPILIQANKFKIKVFSEIEFASLFCKNYVAITGTNGKTTTTELINEIFNKKFKSVACGNIGLPVSKAVLENKHTKKVMEVSSFMLEHAEIFHPHVATILNIEEDHLVRHKTMDEYRTLKLNIFKNLTEKDFVVVNLDEKIDYPKHTKKLTYSTKHLADVYQKNGYIFFKDTKIVAIKDLKLKGEHNLKNVMCAICFAVIYKVKLSKIKEVLTNFTPEKFRIQEVATINDITFVNDSKSTNIASTLAAVNSIKQPIFLLLCGSRKCLNYNLLFSKLPKRVKQIFVFGEISDDLISANKGRFQMQKFEDMKSAFENLTKIVKSGTTVLLSPSSASYDQFKNYVERGEEFNKLVKDYEIKNKN